MSNPRQYTRSDSAITLSDFWTLLASGRIGKLNREPLAGYRGEYEDNSGNLSKFIFSDEEIVAYEFSIDTRFRLSIYKDFSKAIGAVIRSPLFSRASLPHLNQLKLAARLIGYSEWDKGKLGSYKDYHKKVLSRLVIADIELDQVFEELDALTPSEVEFSKYEKTGDLDVLHNEREILFKAFALCPVDNKICLYLCKAIDNSKYEDRVTVAVAIWALGRQNHKDWIPQLIDRLGSHNSIFDDAIQLALQFICSGSTLVEVTPSGKVRDYWKGKTAGLPKTREDWEELDAESVFWEKRLRFVLQNPDRLNDSNQIDNLIKDEVEPVRLATLNCLEKLPLPEVPGKISEQMHRAMEPADIARIVADEQIRLRDRIFISGNAEKFNEELAAIIQHVATIATLEMAAGKSPMASTCRQISGLADYLAANITGSAVNVLLWNVCEKLLAASGNRLNVFGNEMDEIYRIASGDDESKNLEEWLLQHCQVLPDSTEGNKDGADDPI